MSKWIIITAAATLITVGIVIAVLLFFIDKSQAEDDAADKIHLRAKKSILNAAIDAQLNQGVLSREGGKLVSDASNTQMVVSRSNNLLSSAIAQQRDYISKLKEKYRREMK